jgi:hypothetical protein
LKEESKILKKIIEEGGTSSKIEKGFPLERGVLR